MAVLGHAEGDGALVVPDDQIAWSGPPGVIALARDSDVQLVYWITVLLQAQNFSVAETTRTRW